MVDRPAPHELHAQAGGDPDRYRALMEQHGHLIPGTPKPLPCGWMPDAETTLQAARPLRPEDVPADLIDKVHPVTLKHGIPWHDTAVRILAAAVLTEARERIAAAVEAECIDPDWPNDAVSINGATAAGVVRNWPEVIL